MPGLILESFPAAALASPLHGAAAGVRQRAICVAAAEPEVLVEVLRPDVNLAVWNRALPGSLAPGLRVLCDAAPFVAVCEGPPEEAVDALTAKLPVAAPLDLLLDIRALAIAFSGIAETAGAVRIRLEAITGPACHRWHADAVGLRLLCAYRGPGTEWLPIAGGAPIARDLDPKALPCGRAQLATGAVAILKGERYPGNAGFGCIHRSPPAGPGERARLLLCLDEPGRIPLA
ncbi:MAG: DUF1826 domain-containing protein [Acetobacteraceae bacterium]|nr:DUF1826 domain-containing protein [Acetobacteraceae bacterium]